MGCAQECTQANDAVIGIMAGQVKQLHYLIASLAARCVLIARSARCDVRWVAAVFVGSDETIVSGEPALFLTRFVGFSCRSAARTSGRGSRLVATYFVVVRRR